MNPYFLSRQKAVKILSLTMAFIFTATSITPNASGAISFAPVTKKTVKTAEEVFQDVLKNVPSEIGSLNEIQNDLRKSADAKPFVIHIQDAHANPDAQQNIYRLLKYLSLNLTDQKKRLVIGVEGTKGPIHPEYYDFFPEYIGAGEAVVQDLLEKGELTGTELFAWENYKNKIQNTNIVGVEDTALYRDNLKTYQSLLSKRGEFKPWLDQLRSRLFTEQSKILNKDLLRFLKERDHRKEGKYTFGRSNGNGNFSSYLNYLKPEVEKVLEINLLDPIEQLRFPNLIRVLQLQKSEGEFNREKAAKEWSQVLEIVREKAEDPDKALVESLNIFGRQSGFLMGTSSEVIPQNFLGTYPRRLLEKLYLFSQKKKIDLSSFKQFSLSFRFAVFQAEIDAAELMVETENLEEALIKKLATTDAEKAFIRKLKNFQLLEKFFYLELTREEYKEALARRGELRVILRLKAEESKILRSAQNDERLGKLFNQSLHFYETAYQRDRALVANALALADALSPNEVGLSFPTVIVLITGGFHSEGIKEILREQEISFAEYSPRIHTLDNGERYERVMSEVNSDLSAYFKIKNPFPTRQEAMLFKEMLEQSAPAMSLQYKIAPAAMPEKIQQVIAAHSVLKDSITVSVHTSDSESFVRLIPSSNGTHGLSSASVSHYPLSADPVFAAEIDNEIPRGTWPGALELVFGKNPSQLFIPRITEFLSPEISIGKGVAVQTGLISELSAGRSMVPAVRSKARRTGKQPDRTLGPSHPARAEARREEDIKDIAFVEAIQNLNLDNPEDIKALHAIRASLSVSSINISKEQKRLPPPVITSSELQKELEGVMALFWDPSYISKSLSFRQNEALKHIFQFEMDGRKLKEYLVGFFQRNPQSNQFLNPLHVRFIRRISTESNRPLILLNVAKKALSISDFYRKVQKELTSTGIIRAFTEGLFGQVGPAGQGQLILLAEAGFSELALETLDQIARQRAIANENLLRKQIREAGEIARGVRRAEVRSEARNDSDEEPQIQPVELTLETVAKAEIALGGVTLSFEKIDGATENTLRIVNRESGQSFTKTFENGEIITFGRDPRNDFVLDSPTVSHRHLQIEYESRIWYLRDLGSTNGTFYHGRRYGQADGWISIIPIRFFPRAEVRGVHNIKMTAKSLGGKEYQVRIGDTERRINLDQMNQKISDPYKRFMNSLAFAVLGFTNLGKGDAEVEIRYETEKVEILFTSYAVQNRPQVQQGTLWFTDGQILGFPSRKPFDLDFLRVLSFLPAVLDARTRQEALRTFNKNRFVGDKKVISEVLRTEDIEFLRNFSRSEVRNELEEERQMIKSLLIDLLEQMRRAKEVESEQGRLIDAEPEGLILTADQEELLQKLGLEKRQEWEAAFKDAQDKIAQESEYRRFLAEELGKATEELGNPDLNSDDIKVLRAARQRLSDIATNMGSMIASSQAGQTEVIAAVKVLSALSKELHLKPDSRSEARGLVIRRTKNEIVSIGQNLQIRVIEVKGSHIKLRIQAPDNVPVWRREIEEKLPEEGRGAYSVNLPAPEYLGKDFGGLIISRKEKEQVAIGFDEQTQGPQIVMTVLEVYGGRVKLLFEAPRNIPIRRGEIEGIQPPRSEAREDVKEALEIWKDIRRDEEARLQAAETITEHLPEALRTSGPQDFITRNVLYPLNVGLRVDERIDLAALRLLTRTLPLMTEMEREVMGLVAFMLVLNDQSSDRFSPRVRLTAAEGLLARFDEFQKPDAAAENLARELHLETDEPQQVLKWLNQVKSELSLVIELADTFSEQDINSALAMVRSLIEKKEVSEATKGRTLLYTFLYPRKDSLFSNHEETQRILSYALRQKQFSSTKALRRSEARNAGDILITIPLDAIKDKLPDKKTRYSLEELVRLTEYTNTIRYVVISTGDPVSRSVIEPNLFSRTVIDLNHDEVVFVTSPTKAAVTEHSGFAGDYTKEFNALILEVFGSDGRKEIFNFDPSQSQTPLRFRQQMSNSFTRLSPNRIYGIEIIPLVKEETFEFNLVFKRSDGLELTADERKEIASLQFEIVSKGFQSLESNGSYPDMKTSGWTFDNHRALNHLMINIPSLAYARNLEALEEEFGSQGPLSIAIRVWHQRDAESSADSNADHNWKTFLAVADHLKRNLDTRNINDAFGLGFSYAVILLTRPKWESGMQASKERIPFVASEETKLLHSFEGLLGDPKNYNKILNSLYGFDRHPERLNEFVRTLNDLIEKSAEYNLDYTNYYERLARIVGKSLDPDSVARAKAILVEQSKKDAVKQFSLVKKWFEAKKRGASSEELKAIAEKSLSVNEIKDSRTRYHIRPWAQELENSTKDSRWEIDLWYGPAVFKQIQDTFGRYGWDDDDKAWFDEVSKQIIEKRFKEISASSFVGNEYWESSFITRASEIIAQDRWQPIILEALDLALRESSSNKILMNALKLTNFLPITSPAIIQKLHEVMVKYPNFFEVPEEMQLDVLHRSSRPLSMPVFFQDDPRALWPWKKTGYLRELFQVLSKIWERRKVLNPEEQEQILKELSAIKNDAAVPSSIVKQMINKDILFNRSEAEARSSRSEAREIPYEPVVISPTLKFLDETRDLNRQSTAEFLSTDVKKAVTQVAQDLALIFSVDGVVSYQPEVTREEVVDWITGEILEMTKSAGLEGVILAPEVSRIVNQALGPYISFINSRKEPIHVLIPVEKLDSFQPEDYDSIVLVLLAGGKVTFVAPTLDSKHLNDLEAKIEARVTGLIKVNLTKDISVQGYGEGASALPRAVQHLTSRSPKVTFAILGAPEQVSQVPFLSNGFRLAVPLNGMMTLSIAAGVVTPLLPSIPDTLRYQVQDLPTLVKQHLGLDPKDFAAHVTQMIQALRQAAIAA